jgi:hypothetical protein
MGKPRPCSVRGCKDLRHLAEIHCLAHHNSRIKKGTENGIALSGRTRRPYVRAAQTIITRLVKAGDAPTLGLLHELTATLRTQIDQSLTLHNWRSYKPKAKAQCVLRAIHKRFPEGDQAAEAIAATVLGTLLCVAIDPDIADRGERMTRFLIMRALSNLMRPEKIVASNGLLLKYSRPFPTGHLVPQHLHNLVTTRIRFFLRESPTFNKAVLTFMLTHKTPQRGVKFN